MEECAQAHTGYRVNAMEAKQGAGRGRGVRERSIPTGQLKGKELQTSEGLMLRHQDIREANLRHVGRLPRLWRMKTQEANWSIVIWGWLRVDR